VQDHDRFIRVDDHAHLADGPRRTDGSLAFVSGACVYLPPGYASGALRYATLYCCTVAGATSRMGDAGWHPEDARTTRTPLTRRTPVHGHPP